MNKVSPSRQSHDFCKNSVGLFLSANGLFVSRELDGVFFWKEKTCFLVSLLSVFLRNG